MPVRRVGAAACTSEARATDGNSQSLGKCEGLYFCQSRRAGTASFAE